MVSNAVVSTPLKGDYTEKRFILSIGEIRLTRNLERPEATPSILQNKLQMNEIEVFINRMKHIGIELQLMGNVPWIYLHSVNGNRVKREDWNANHGYTIAWYPVRADQKPHLDQNIKRTFEVIRKYK